MMQAGRACGHNVSAISRFQRVVAAGKGVDYSLPKLGDQSRSALCGSSMKFNSSALPIACSSSSQRRTVSTVGASMQDNGGSACVVSSFLAYIPDLQDDCKRNFCTMNAPLLLSAGVVRIIRTSDAFGIGVRYSLLSDDVVIACKGEHFTWNCGVLGYLCNFQFPGSTALDGDFERISYYRSTVKLSAAVFGMDKVSDACGIGVYYFLVLDVIVIDCKKELFVRS